VGVEKLFGKGKYRIISVFLENKEVELHFREICRISGLTQPTVLDHLDVLTELGFLKVRKNMNQTLYSIDFSSPITEKILRFFEK
jgi:DNA-binding transcriptional ArsR family regulator